MSAFTLDDRKQLVRVIGKYRKEFRRRRPVTDLIARNQWTHQLGLDPSSSQAGYVGDHDFIRSRNPKEPHGGRLASEQF